MTTHKTTKKHDTDAHRATQKRTIWLPHERLPAEFQAIKNWLDNPKRVLMDSPKKRKKSEKTAI